MKLFRNVSFRIALPLVVLAVFLESPGLRARGGKFIDFLDSFDDRVQDGLFRARPIDASPTNVVVAAIDEKSLDELGRWPWPRRHMAHAIERMRDLGVKVIALDTVFDAITDPVDDAAYAKALKETPQVVAGYFWYWDDSEVPKQGIDFSERSFQIAPNSFQPTVDPKVAEAPRAWSHPVGLVTSYAAASDASPQQGFFNADPDPSDGIMRRLPTFAQFKIDNGNYPSLGLKAVSVFLAKPFQVSTQIENGILTARDIRIEGLDPIPLDRTGSYRLNWRGLDRSIPYVSISDLAKSNDKVHRVRRDADGAMISEDVDAKSALAGKIVLVGATAIGIGDVRTTPWGAMYPGPELHATFIDNVLSGHHVRQARTDARLYGWYLAGLAIFGLLFAWALSVSRALTGALIFFVALVAYGGLEMWLFRSYGILIGTAVPVGLLFGLNFSVLTVYKFFTEERERSKVKGTFEKYVSKAVVDEMLKDPSKLQLKGERRELSVMFSDIRSFTTMSESLDPQQVSALLNEYLSPMTDIVFATGGTLDKYIGDAVMAFWGAPLALTDHTLRACEAALQMQARLREINVAFEAKSWPKLEVGIGINSGEVSVGNMGSQKIFSYTVLGDNVNLASRVEGLTKAYGVGILIGEGTRATIGDAFILREVDRVRVKGKTKPVTIFELVAKKGEALTPARALALEGFAKGLAAYYDRQWQVAAELFTAAAGHDPSEKTAKIFHERCSYWAAHDPGPEWDGSWEMKEK